MFGPKIMLKRIADTAPVFYIKLYRPKTLISSPQSSDNKDIQFAYSAQSDNPL